MAVKILGQVNPSSTSNVDLYTVPLGKSTVVSSLTITNVTSGTPTVRIFIRVAGATAAAGNALVYDGPLVGNDMKPLTIGITLAATDVVTVQASVANAVTFQLFGSED